MNLIDIDVIASGSKGNAYSISDTGQTILIDPGISRTKWAKRTSLRFSEIDFALVSHEHKDHCQLVPDLLRMGVHVAGSQGTMAGFKTAGLFFSILKAETVWEKAGWKVLPFPIVHDSAEPLGFLIQSPHGSKICYASDTAYIEYKFTGVNFWIIECNHDREILKENRHLPESVKTRIRGSHFELKNLLAFLMAQDMSVAERIYLIHLSSDNSDHMDFKSKVEMACGVPVYI